MKGPSIRYLATVPLALILLGVAPARAHADAGSAFRQEVESAVSGLVAASPGARIERSTVTGLPRFLSTASGRGIPVAGRSLTLMPSSLEARHTFEYFGGGSLFVSPAQRAASPSAAPVKTPRPTAP
jgi:hypothetical protein